MSRANTGTFTITSNSFSDAVAATPISPTDANTTHDELVAGINDSIGHSYGGQSTTIATGATTDIGAEVNTVVGVSGTSTITSLGGGLNKLRVVHHIGAHILTHNATSLILPSGANITTATGDTSIWRSDASGNFRCVNYQKATGAPVGDVSTGQVVGTATNDSATAGDIGEYMVADLVQGSATSLVSGTQKTVISVPLTAGDWLVSGMGGFIGNTTTTVTFCTTSISAVDNTDNTTNGRISRQFFNGATPFVSMAINLPVGPFRISLSGTTTIYLVNRANFGVSTCTGFGVLQAWRVR